MLIYLLHAGFSDIKIPYIGEVVGLNYMSAILKSNNYKTVVIDCLLEQIKQCDIISKIIEDMPSILVLSIYEMNKEEVFDFVRAIRKKGYLNPVVFVGIYTTLNTKQLLNEIDDVDNIWAIRGEPEEAIVEFSNEIKNGDAFPQSNKVVYKFDSNFVNLNNVNVIQNIDSLPFPDDSIMNRMYNKINVSSYILSSRGCYGNCSFCILNVYNSCVTVSNGQSKWRARSISSVVDEMEMLAHKYPNNLIKFADSNFMGDNPNRGIELSEELKHRNLKCKFAIECRANDVEENNFKALRDVGLVSVFLGIESGSENVLKRYKKEISICQNQEAIDILTKLNIGLKMGFILFDEYSTLDELEENTKFLHKNKSCVFHPYRPLIIEKYSINGKKANSVTIQDERTRIAYNLIKKTCQKIFPYKTELNRCRKLLGKRSLEYQDCVFSTLGKFVLFDKHGMDLLLSLCRDHSCSAEIIEEEFISFVNQFLENIVNDFIKLEKCSR